MDRSRPVYLRLFCIDDSVGFHNAGRPRLWKSQDGEEATQVWRLEIQVGSVSVRGDDGPRPGNPAVVSGVCGACGSDGKRRVLEPQRNQSKKYDEQILRIDRPL